MSLPPDLLRLAAAVAHARTGSFVALARVAGLNPAQSFRGADLRRVDFGTDDLAGFCFHGCDLRGANLRAARNLDWKMLKDALLDGALLPKPPDFDLDEAVRLIERGQAPPEPWWPFITQLPEEFDPSDFYRKGLACTTLAPLAGLTNLLGLSLTGAAIFDLEPIAGLSNLKTLDLSRTKVANLAPLAGLNSLTTLILDNTRVADLAPIARLNNLTSLWLINTPVADLAPIAGLKNLTVRIGAGEAIRPANLARRGKSLLMANILKALRPRPKR